MIRKIVVLSFKAVKLVRFKLMTLVSKLYCEFLFYTNNVLHGTFSCYGKPYINVNLQGKCIIGNHFHMNNGYRYNPIGRNQPCYLVVDADAILTIGDNVGMSSAAIVCQNRITIGNHVMIGGGTCIYDTDFHSLDSNLRLDVIKDRLNKKTKPVIIGDNVFIGAHVTILKGVKIGNNCIIGACSVVTKSVPEGEIWAGNPAKFIKIN